MANLNKVYKAVILYINCVNNEEDDDDDEYSLLGTKANIQHRVHTYHTM